MTETPDTRTDQPFIRIPRWRSRHDTPGQIVARYEVDIPRELVAAVSDMGDVPAVLFATYAKVISMLTGERDVVIGYRATAGADMQSCRLDVRSGSWQSLIADADSAVRADHGHDEHDFRADRPLFETLLDVTGWLNQVHERELGDLVLVCGFRRSGDSVKLRMTYRNDVFDGDYAIRLAGYYLRALEVLVADPVAAHHEQSLLSPDEVHRQLHGMTGPRVELPDRRFDELFADQAAARPDSIAVEYDGGHCTYGELDRRATRIANSLRHRGVRTEDVVAVASDRSVNWIAAIVGVFRAGGVYLPVDPGDPAGRIAATLSLSACRFMLFDRSDMTGLRDAMAEVARDRADPVESWSLDAAIAEGSDTPVSLPARPGQLAYIYFTSGSTGEPKGAMCEHEGMLNHLLAKLYDLGMNGEDVVVQNAPVTFDISLWQAIAPLLVGGRSLLLGRDVVLDPRRFAAEVVRAGATVLQMVPSYFEVLLNHLEDDDVALGPMRSVVVTGEAIKKELVERWFAVCDVPLVNAYGATEASDDTTHQVMRRPPAEDLVPVGRPIHNVQVLVVDERLSVVPLGSPGEIVFSGICVGRGYINDEERSRLVFVRNPYQPDQRMYRTGDFGRWLPSGSLEFLGRRDEQVKIRGFRIEIGEIEDRILRMPGVRDAAVVVREEAGAKSLVGFYSSNGVVLAATIRDFLRAELPDYMVPAHLHQMARLPLTSNGKIDKKGLVDLAATLGQDGANYVAPQTPTERRIARAWADVLGVAVERIGRDDHFFDRGGSSLAAVRLVMKLRGAVSLKDLVGTPVLVDLAAAIDGRSSGGRSCVHLLSTFDVQTATAALVCFPDAGGNALNLKALAEVLEGDAIAVHGIELTGQDPGQEGELPGAEEIVERVVLDVTERIDMPVAILGQGTGAALALAVARILGDRRAEADPGGVPSPAPITVVAASDDLSAADFQHRVRADVSDIACAVRKALDGRTAHGTTDG